MPRKKIRKKASQCAKKINGERCLGKYILTYEENTPYFVCDKCGDTNLTWKKFYDEYLQLFRVKDNWKEKKHQVSCIIGFFCYSYKQFYGVEYIFVPRSVNPYSCKECVDANLLLKTFNGNAHTVRKYIYWFFNKFLSFHTQISSLGYLNSPGIIRKYNLYKKKNNRLYRSSKLPNSFQDWCTKNIPEIFQKYTLSTMNDLGAILQSSDANMGMVEEKLIYKAITCGLIKNNKINVGDL